MKLEIESNLFQLRDGADDETTRLAVESDGEKDHVVVGGLDHRGQGSDNSALADRRKGKPSFRRVPLKTCEEVLRLYQEKYFDLSMRHFHEKLREEYNIELSRNTLTGWGRLEGVRKALQEAHVPLREE